MNETDNIALACWIKSGRVPAFAVETEWLADKQCVQATEDYRNEIFYLKEQLYLLTKETKDVADSWR